MRAFVVVLGDVGRSPRMQFHVQSFLSRGWSVDLFGYGGSSLNSEIRSNTAFRVSLLCEPPSCLRRLPNALSFGLRIIWQAIMLFFALFFRLSSADLILVQNPPSVPAVCVCWLVARMRRSRLVVDWHNYMHSVLALQLGGDRAARHPFVRTARAVETWFGRRADANLCVTHAMRKDLWTRWGIRAVTLYDRPGAKFRAITVDEEHSLWCRLMTDYPLFGPASPEDDSDELTLFTHRRADGTIERLKSRPAIIVSSTSWTADEDFGLLLRALCTYDRALEASTLRRPDIVAIVTGKGPEKAAYVAQIAEMEFKHVRFVTPWLADADDYARVLAAADLGVCLHTSTSGLDLPMKVVDMFGARLPVVAYRFACIDELVAVGENGHLFSTEAELCGLLQRLLAGFPDATLELRALKENLVESPLVSWAESWEATVWPLVEALCVPVRKARQE